MIVIADPQSLLVHVTVHGPNARAMQWKLPMNRPYGLGIVHCPLGIFHSRTGPPDAQCPMPNAQCPKGRSSLAQAARPGYRCDGMLSAACRAALPFNFSCISPALQAGGIFTCRFPRALPWAKASRARLRRQGHGGQAFGAGSWSHLTSEIGGARYPRTHSEFPLGRSKQTVM